MREIVICVSGLSVSCGWKGPFRECKYAEPGWTRGSPPLLNSSWPLPSCGGSLRRCLPRRRRTFVLRPCLRLRLISCFRCRLALYVYEYLLHVGAQKSAQTFLSEVSKRFDSLIKRECHPRARIHESWHCWHCGLHSRSAGMKCTGHLSVLRDLRPPFHP